MAGHRLIQYLKTAGSKECLTRLRPRLQVGIFAALGRDAILNPPDKRQYFGPLVTRWRRVEYQLEERADQIIFPGKRPVCKQATRRGLRCSHNGAIVEHEQPLSSDH